MIAVTLLKMSSYGKMVHYIFFEASDIDIIFKNTNTNLTIIR